MMIGSCDYCLKVFNFNYWSWCRLSNEDDNTFTTLCSCCAAEILKNNKISDEINAKDGE